MIIFSDILLACNNSCQQRGKVSGMKKKIED
ncbi:hypothetical protein BB2000_0579 [Proteus mirabilis BB2000]|nr:hypothetical protein BB2000_0579 [Proteus mirabilis BB2000]